MSNPLKGEVSFKSGEVEHRLVFTIDALIELEDRFDKTVQQIGEMLGENLRMKDLRTVFAVGLQQYRPGITDAEAGQIMSEIGITEAGALVGKAFMAAFGAGEEAKETARPRKAAGGNGQPA